MRRLMIIIMILWRSRVLEEMLVDSVYLWLNGLGSYWVIILIGLKNVSN